MAVNEGSKAAGFKMCPDMPFITQDPTTPQNYILDTEAEREYMNIRTDTSYQQQMDCEFERDLIIIITDI